MRRSVTALLALWFAAGCSAWGESYLIVPFVNLSKSPNIDWIGESISETIREVLASEQVTAIAREDGEEAARRLRLKTSSPLTKASLIKLGESLGAGGVVHGEFSWTQESDSSAVARGSLRITARVLDLRRMRRGPEFIETGAMADLSALQTRLAWQTLRFVSASTPPSEQEFFDRHPPVRIDAMENYIRGLLASSPEHQHRFFTQAARLDSRFSQPCFHLGRMQWERKNYRVASQWFERVTEGGGHYLEASFFLGLCRYHIGEYEGAAAAFSLVARSLPLNEVYNNLGVTQLRRNLPGALDNILKALEGDSTDPDYHFNAGYALWKQGDFNAAADRFRAVLDRTPDDASATMMLGRCLQQGGPRAGDLRTDGLGRLKENYEEVAFRQLQELLGSAKQDTP